MTEMKGQNWQDVQESALGVIGTAARTTNESILSKINLHLDVPVRLYAALTPDSKLYFGPSITEAGDGAAKTVLPVEGTLTQSVSGSIDYQVIVSPVSGITLTLEGGAYAHPVASSSGKYVAGVFVRKKDGTFDCKYSTIQNSFVALQSIDLGTLFQAIGGLPVGYIYLVSTDNAGRWKTVGSSTSIIENKTGNGSVIGRIQSAVDLDYFINSLNTQSALLQSVSSNLQSQINGLQTQIDTLNNEYPMEEYYECVSAGHRVYTVSGFTFNADNSKKDIQVFRNMGRLKYPKDFSKTSTTAILLTFDPAIGDEILIDKRR